ncbi:MAG: glycolate oxidase subunit GlcE [Limnobacter sp.]|nr:glycolate oxidase subunit GlcE [Limnobacter sp.]
MSQFIDQLCDRVEKAARSSTPLRIVGGGTKNFYGGDLEGEPIDLHTWSGIIAYEPTELVMSVKAGTPLADVESALEEQGQELAFEPPRFGKQSTIGGTIAAGLSGPARLAKGPVKDFILGCTLIDGKGQLLHFGGEVMKNVAGYDVSRVFPGSLGTLGIAVDLSIKVLPKAPAQSTLKFEMDYNQAIRKVNQWLGTPLPINATLYLDGVLYIRLRGAKAAVSKAVTDLNGHKVAEKTANKLWNEVRDQTHPLFNTTQDLWRLSVPQTTPDLGLKGEQLVEWGGAVRWLVPTKDTSVEMIRKVCERAGGHATWYHYADKKSTEPAFHAPSPAMANLQRRLKEQFDPAGIFNPGRMSPLF